MAVTFPGYRDSYLAAYRDAHRARRWQEDRRRAEELSNAAGRAKKPSSRSKPDQAFDRGWQDGFEGKIAKPPNPPEQAEAYRNGHRLGARDRDYARARQLRAEKMQDHSRSR